MNKQIKQLVEQAGAEELGADLYGGPFIGAIRMDFLEKFAVLVAKECIEQIHGADVGDLKAKSYYLDKVAEHIENYFGIDK